MSCLKFFVIFSIFASRSEAEIYYIPASTIELKLGFGSVKASLGDDGKLKELVIYDGSKVFKVPADELKDLNSPDIRKLQVVTTQKKDFKSPSKWGQ